MAHSTFTSETQAPGLFGSSETMAVLASSGAFISASLAVFFLAALIGLTGLPLTHLLLNWLSSNRVSENYRKTLEPVSVSLAPLAVFGWIAVLNIFSIGYWLLLCICGFKKSYQISKLKAVIATSPLIFWGLLLVTLMLQSQKVIGQIV
jgi:hypothetical protein